MAARAGWGPGRWLVALDQVSNRLMVLLVVATLAGGHAVIWLDGGAVSVSRHLFYVPIVLAALRFGAAPAVLTALAAALLAGPLAGASASPTIFLGRGAAFVLIGLIVGGFSSAHARAARIEADVSKRERALVAQRAALVQIVSHELRTPLTVLRGSVETLVARDTLVDPARQELVRAMERSILRLQEMIDVSLAAADELDGDPQPQHVDVAAVVEHAADSLPERLRHRLRFEIPSGASMTTVEPQLWLTLRCLLDNADKFSPADGVVRVTYLEVEDEAIFRIEDEGPGLPHDFGDEAFEPFVQADATERRSHPGLGMGLYTARRLARRLGGEVVLRPRESRPGTLAEVRLPRCDVARAAAAARAAQRPERTRP